MSDRFALRGDVRAIDLRILAAWAERFLDAIHNRLQGDIEDVRFSIRFFAKEEEFRCYAASRGAPTAESFYDFKHAEIVLFQELGADSGKLAAALMHALALEYLDRALGIRSPAWLLEGLAGYFSHYEVVDGGVIPGAALMKEMKQALQSGSFVPLHRLIGLDLSAFQSEAGRLLCLEAAALVHFLTGRDRELIQDLAHGTPLEWFEDLKSLESEWKVWMGSSCK
ncbi:MAG: hypothetical protein HY716_04600 [Planctomycetes bacterium]|nr:hypothetical protein [Planctomycetota bacterium]